VLSQGDDYTECVCGGAQLRYFKKEWEEKFKKESEPVQNGEATHLPAVVDSEQIMLLQT
jgi:hypothetical protein